MGHIKLKGVVDDQIEVKSNVLQSIVIVESLHRFFLHDCEAHGIGNNGVVKWDRFVGWLSKELGLIENRQTVNNLNIYFALDDLPTQGTQIRIGR